MQQICVLISSMKLGPYMYMCYLRRVIGNGKYMIICRLACCTKCVGSGKIHNPGRSLNMLIRTWTNLLIFRELSATKWRTILAHKAKSKQHYLKAVDTIGTL